MKEVFGSYLRKSEEEIKAIWDNGLITFDTNVLLNLYRYSTKTSDTMLDVMDKLKGKIFLTHQAGLEFHKRRFDIIAEQEKIYSDFFNKFSPIDDALKSKRHPFLSDKLYQKLKKLFSEIEEEINNSKENHRNLSNKDSIYSKIDSLFKGRITNPFSEEELLKIYNEGEKRYKDRIPPGYKDEEKGEKRKFGDLVLWKHVIEKAKKEQKSIILITDDAKEDWWWKNSNSHNNTIGARPELMQELKQQANVEYHQYDSDRFLEFAINYLGLDEKPQVIEEVRETSRSKIWESLVDESSYSLSDSFSNKWKTNPLQIDIDSILDNTFKTNGDKIEEQIKQLENQKKIIEGFLFMTRDDAKVIEYEKTLSEIKMKILTKKLELIERKYGKNKKVK